MMRDETMTTIATGHLLLSAPAEQDLASIASLLADIDVSRMLARVPHPYTLEHAEGWFAKINVPGAGGERVFAIALDGQPVGMVGFQDKGGEPILGYWLGRPFWGRGLMSEAARAAVEWYFDEYDDAALFSGAFEDNPASLRIQQKLGFEVTGSALLDCLATGEPRPEVRTWLARETFARLQAENSPASNGLPLTGARKRAT